LREGDAGNQNLNGSVEKIQKLLVQAFWERSTLTQWRGRILSEVTDNI
jgi:hypothetical protein